MNQSVLYWIKKGGDANENRDLSHRGERRVGVVDEQRKTVSAFSLPRGGSRMGVLAVIEAFSIASLSVAGAV